MRGISYEEDGAIRIGSLTSFSHITKDPIIRSISTYLGKLLIWLVDHRSVTSERSVETHVMVLHPLIPLQHFMHGMQLLRSQDRTEFAESRSMTSILKQESLIRNRRDSDSVIIPKEAYEGYHGHYIKYAMRNAMDIATTGCSVNVKLSEDKEDDRGCQNCLRSCRTCSDACTFC